MAYEMTPQERMQRAALLRAQREARLGYTPTVTEDLSRYLITPTEQSVGSVAPVASQETDDSDNNGDQLFDVAGRTVATGLDIGSKAISVPVQILENLFDIGASIVGSGIGWLSEDFQNEMEKVVAYEATKEIVINPLDELGLKHSYLNEEGVGQQVDGILDSVIELGALSALYFTPLAPAVPALYAASAGGASVQEALNDGANLREAANYGVTSGAISYATERIAPGSTKWLLGKGLVKGSNVAAQGGMRILKNMAGEAAEEGFESLLNPVAKTTYKGTDALKEYGEIDFYENVLKDAAAGATVDFLFGQTFGRAMHHAGADADISDAQDAVNNLLKKQRADQAKGVYDNAESDADVMANLENISKTLKKASPEKRAKLIERHDLSQAFTESGEIKPEFAASFTGGTKNTAPNGTTGDTEGGRGYNRAFYSASLRGSEAKIASDVERIQESLRNVERNRLEQNGLDPSGAENVTVKVFDGELSETGKKNLSNAHGFMNNVSDRTSTGMNMVVVDSGGNMNGVVLKDGNTVYIDASTLEDGSFMKVAVEEVAHFSEGSKSYRTLYKFIAEDEDLLADVVGDLVADGNSYGFTVEDFESLTEKVEAGETDTFTAKERMLLDEINAHMVAETFGNEAFMQKVIKGEPTLAEKMIARIKALKNALSGNESAEARTERKRLEKAEKLWMKSVEDAGYKYIKGKLIKRRREEEEENKKAASSTENVQEAEGESGAQFSFSSISNSFFGDPDMTVKEFESGKYKETAAYQKYVNDCVNNMKQSRKGLTEKAIRAEVEKSIDGIVRVAIAMKKAGYDIYDDPRRKNARDSKNRSLFSSLEPNSDYFTSSDISTICDKRKNFAQIYDDIVEEEERRGVPESKRFFKNVDNYFYIHKVLADKGLTQPCKECYVESMRKNLAPMANAFLELIRETDPNNKKNKQLYDGKGKIKANNSEKRERMLKILDDYGMTAYDLNVNMLSTEKGLAALRLTKPEIYEEFNSFYGQSKPKMPRGATPFRFGELTALLTDNNGNINWKLVDKINHTGGFRLQSYSDFQVQNFADVLQVIFEAGTLGLTGHAYTKVPMFLETTEGTNLKRNISIFMYNDAGEWKIDKNDSFPGTLEEIYKLVENDKSGNTSIIAVSQNADMSAWIMANDLVGYGIPFHKSGLKMDTVRGTIVKEGGREILGYKDVKDHTKQQTEVYAHTTADHKANTKVKKSIDIYEFWDFKNVRNLSKEALIKKNLMKYIDKCEEVGYRPKFREYLTDNKSVLDKTLAYAKKLGFVAEDATVDAISFKYKGYRIPYGYYKFLGDFGMFTPDGKASPPKVLSLSEYDFDAAVDMFKDSEALRRKELLQQFANDGERQRMIESGASNEELEKSLARKRSEVVDEIVNRGKKSDAQFSLKIGDRTVSTQGRYKIDVESAQLLADINAQNDIENYLPKGLSANFIKAIKRSGGFARPRLYRGMDASEFDYIFENGFIKSNSSYNFSHQQGRTYFSPQFQTSLSYATGFAPAGIRERFFEDGMPAYIVEVGNYADLNFVNEDTIESYTNKEVDVKYITRIIELMYDTETEKVMARDIDIPGMDQAEGEMVHGVPLFYKDKITGTILYAHQDSEGYEDGKYISEKNPDMLFDYNMVEEHKGGSFDYNGFLGISGDEANLVLYDVTVDNADDSVYNGDAQFSLKIKYVDISDSERAQLLEKIKPIYGEENGVADGLAVNLGLTVYVVDSGKEKGDINFQVRKKVEFVHEVLLKKYMEGRNNDAVRKGLISDGIVKRIRRGLGLDRRLFGQEKYGSSLSDLNEQSENNIEGVQEGIQGQSSDQVSGLTDSEIHAAYQKAVAENDMETAQRMVDEKARRWSGKNALYIDDWRTGKKQYVFYRPKTNGHAVNKAKNIVITSNVANADAQDPNGKHISVYAKATKAFAIDAREYDDTHIPVANNSPKWLKNKAEYDLVLDKKGEFDQNLYITSDDLRSAAFKNGYDAVIIKNVKDTENGTISSNIILEDGAVQMKSADPITYDRNGKEIPLSQRFDSEYPNSSFSLPNKNVKRNANRSRTKTYTRDDAKAIADAVLADAVKLGEYTGKVKGKTKLYDALWKELNETEETSGKRGGMALDMADAIIESITVSLSANDPVMEEYSARLNVLREYLHKFNLDPIKADLKGDKGILAYYSRWHDDSGKGMSPDQIAKKLKESGIEIEAEKPADILVEVDRLYTEAADGIKTNSNIVLGQIMTDEEMEAYRQKLAKDILRATVNKGSTSKLASFYYEKYEELAKRMEVLTTKLNEAGKVARQTRDVIYRANRLKAVKLGTYHAVSQYDDKTFKATIESLGSITRGGQLMAGKAREICGKLDEWMDWITDEKRNESALMESQRYDLDGIKKILGDLASMQGDFSLAELQNLSYALAGLTNYVESYGKIRRQGKLIEAKPIADGYVKKITAANKIPRGLIRRFFESGFMGNFSDPATLMRYADGYDDGFFTETFNEFREGAVTVAVTRMELMQDHDAFMKSHKKYADHLAETVEFRGNKMTRSTAIALWMTSKRTQAQLGLVKSGIKYRYEPIDKAGKKGANGVKVFDVAPLGDPNADYTQDDIDQFMKDLRADLEKSFTDADRQYIALAERIFDECGDIKREVDIERTGVSNVADGYYFPIVRADKAQSMDTESWREAVDRVNNLSMNKDTVKGAKSRLFIGDVDTILKSHVNQVALYKGISTAVDNYNVLVNLDIGGNPAAPISINDQVTRTDFGKEALNYLKKLKEDIEQINRREIDDRGFVSLTQRIRGNYATYQLGANPKVWVTQLSSFVAANDVLDADSIAKGMTIANKKLANGETEVDKYCPLAKQRNLDNVAYEAQSVSARVTNKIGEVMMLPVGKVDRFVVERLWGACQVQVEKNGGAKVGTVENKTEAGKLLQKVILETQQNALPTERSSAMRSTSEIKKTLTMFSADAMKIIGRVFDGFGRYYFSKQRLKVGNLTDEQRKHFEAEKKAGFKQFRKATAVLLAQSVLMALIALGFKALLAQLDEEEPEEIATEFAVDAIGNTLGGLPVFRDVYGFLMQGYELDSYLYSSFNDMMTSVKNVGDLAEKTINGEATSQDYAKSIRSAFYSAGQIFGLPTRNVYKYTTGIVKRVSPETGYAIDAAFTKPSIKSDLKKAIEAGDTKMVARIAEVATSENYGMYSESTRKSLKSLVEAGYTVFPRSVGDTVTVDGETYELSSEQKKRFAKVYAVSDKAVEELVKLRQYKNATDEEKAKALKYIYDTYYSVALDDLMGTDTTQKSVLFAEVLDVELLAMIVAHVSTLTADKDKDGKTINGSRKNKIVAYVNSLNLSAAEKYMVMGYLGYTNVNGKNQVETLINRSSLSRTEKETLLANSGY